MPGRNVVGDYRYGYQGEYSEKDEETGLNAFQLRMYDSRINRWLSPDPYGQFHSPYMAMGNNWTGFVDPDGGLCQDAQGNSIPCPDGYGALNDVSDIGVFDNGEFVGYGLEEVVISNLSYPLAGSPLNSSGGIFSNYNFAGAAGSNMATFNANRSKGRKHAARDLYTDAGANVSAIGPGEIISVGSFYAGTNQVTIRHDFSVGNNTVDAIIRYGELSPLSTSCLSVGQCIEQGDILGETGSLIKSNGKPVLTISGRQIYMLHLEVYSGVMGYDLTRNPLTNRGNKPFQRRSDLIDANDLLETIQH